MVSNELKFCFDVIALAKKYFHPLLISRNELGVVVTASTGFYHTRNIYSIQSLYAIGEENFEQFAEMEKRRIHEEIKKEFEKNGFR